ncbi:MAG: hypothetical protein FWE12_05955 [Oscillospiraceae bacterium]|nr:hypothetical protein [Oscillospiraceae bacterium]
MNRSFLEHLLDCIGAIDDAFLEEAETPYFIYTKPRSMGRILQYSAYGAAGLAVLGGAAAAFWRLRSGRSKKSA